MFLCLSTKQVFISLQIKMPRRAYCHCNYNTKDCFHTSEDVSF